MSEPSLYRVCVIGTPLSGKSSVIKRMVSHRFDNIPTSNAKFMDMPSDGRYVSRFPVPEGMGKLASAAKKGDLLLELQDQLEQNLDLDEAMRDAHRPWFVGQGSFDVAIRRGWLMTDGGHYSIGTPCMRII